MKKIILLLLLSPVLVVAQSYAKKAKVLFLGNSYTYVNNLPLLIYNIALANGDSLIYDGNLVGGYTFGNHFGDALSLSKINAAAWDYVVLQAQSQEPSFPPAQVSAQVLPYALKLDSAVKQNNACASTVFYETWGRKNGDASNCGFYAPLCTYSGMQARLRQSYKLFADTCQELMSPVGEAFRSSIAANPALELYDADQSHPSLSGSYLAACVFYEVLFQKSAVGNTYNPGIATGTLSFLQQTAHATVNDSLPVWNLGKNAPWANFGMTALSTLNYQFQSNSPLLNTTWYFGDGGNDNTVNPAHAYASAGTYTVSHVVSDGCKKDSMARVISVIITGSRTSELSAAVLQAYPDPCTDRVYISGSSIFENSAATIELSDASGRLLYRGDFNKELATGDLKNGIYFLKVTNNSATACLRFIKNE